jgi:hypothetical protein
VLDTWVSTGSREENASNQKTRARLRFNRKNALELVLNSHLVLDGIDAYAPMIEIIDPEGMTDGHCGCKIFDD